MPIVPSAILYDLGIGKAKVPEHFNQGVFGNQRVHRKSSLVGLVLPELDNPIFPAFAQVMETLLAQHGYTPVLCTQTPGGVSEDEYVDLLLERGARLRVDRAVGDEDVGPVQPVQEPDRQ